MTYEEALEKLIAEGAIREYKISESLAFVYRYEENSYQARGVYGHEGDWKLGSRLVSSLDYSDQSGWQKVLGLPWQAYAIDNAQAMQNPGYAFAIIRQCYTCKEEKTIDQFSHAQGIASRSRDWECDECYQRRMREMAQYEESQSKRKGDALSKETLASPPPAESEI
jgi:hypothetical protein